MTYVETGTYLDRILARTTIDVAERRQRHAQADLERAALARPAPLSLRERLAQPGMSVIAEIKRASPSRGRFPVDVDPQAIAAEYVLGGAAGISVLTDEPFFQGCLADMDAAAGVAHAGNPPVPILRKDFIVDAYQIVEARAHGADAVLLIVAALADLQMRELFTMATDWGLDTLVEVHDDRELERAFALGATIIGINNRDLKTFSVDLGTTEQLAPLAPDGAVIVAESGVFGPTEIDRLERAGADAVLVGEGLIRAENRAEALQALWSRPE